jgi:hypothetical protein
MSDTPPETPQPAPDEPEAPPPAAEAPPPAAEAPPAPPVEAPPPSYAATPPQAYAEAPMGMPPVMAAPAKGGSGLRTVIIAVVLVAVILVAIIGYAVVGYASGESKVSAATNTLNAVIVDQNKLISTFDEINSKFNAINTSSNFDAKQAKTVATQFIADQQAAGTTIDGDSATIAAADPKLDEQSWLTVIDKSRIDKMHTRFSHAQKGLAAAKFVAAGYVQDGQFLAALLDCIIDLDKLGTQAQANDITGVIATIGVMKTHVSAALGLASAPGLSPDVKAFMVDFQAMTDDFQSLFNAAINGDDAGVTNYSNKVQADVTKLGTHSTDKWDTDLKGFYQSYIDTFNSEFSAATAS